MCLMQFKSPAKINLFLKILHRREDGYHELASLFQTISLFDTIHFEFGENDNLTCTDPTIPCNDSNLISKALTLFRHHTGFNKPLSIHLEKKIPHQAGLGGGSSNAATTLWALNSLLPQPLPLQDLIQWGSTIGSDVPFFLSRGTAYCTGRGEKIRPMPPLPETPLVIIKPPFGSSTPEVYKALNLKKDLPSADPILHLKSFYEQKPHYFNDLEQAAFQVNPPLKTLKEKLIQCGFQTVLLSGSGSSFFCIGNASLVKLPDCEQYQVKTIHRKEDNWY